MERENPDAIAPNVDGREPLEVAAPAPDVGKQPGYQVLDEAPSRGGSKLVWTALVVAVAILAGYFFGAFR